MTINMSYLESAKVYKDFYSWLNESASARGIVDAENLETENVIELRKKAMKTDFLTTFIIICDVSYAYIKDKDEKIKIVKNIIGSVLGRLIFETSNIEQLNKIIGEFFVDEDFRVSFQSWVDDRRDGYIWIKATKIDALIIDYFEKSEKIKKEILFKASSKGMTRGEYAIYELALITGSSYMDMESMLARGISRTSLCNILYSYIMIKQLIDAMGRDFYLAWYEDCNLFKGSSGINHFFDGLILLKEEDISDPWLLKCVTTSHNPLDAIEYISSTLEDINIKKCIVFLPTYPSENAMRFSVHAFSEHDQEIIILYLNDLYALLRHDMMSESGEIKKYLENRRIKP